MHDFIRATDLMSKNYFFIDINSTIFDAAGKMRESDCDFLIVCENSIPKGVVTEKDIIKVAFLKKGINESVSSIMTVPIISTDSSSSLFEILNLMNKNKISKIPVIDNGEVVGIIYNQDMTKGILEVNSILTGHLRFEEETTEKIDQIMKKILMSSKQVKDLSESLSNSPTTDSMDIFKDYIKQRSSRISMLIETIINLAILADDIDIEDENKTKEIDNKIKEELEKAVKNVEQATQQLLEK